MNIGEVFARAWNIIWKNKILWVFGVFAGLAGGSGGNNFNYTLTQNGEASSLPISIPVWAAGLLLLLCLVLLIVFVCLSALGRAGLVRGAWLTDGGEEHLTFNQLFHDSQKYFWRVLLVSILVFAISLVLALALIVPSVLTCGIMALCMVPLFILLSVIVELATIAIVGEDLAITESLQRAWGIVRTNLALIIAVGLVIVIISAVTGFLASLPLIAILAPTLILIGSNTGQISGGALMLSLLLFLLYLPILLGAQAIVTSYVTSTWTVAFRRLTGRNAANLPGGPAPVL
jgi:hypothetical protein